MTTTVQTVTVTSTSTIQQSTTTIAASAGFIPLESQLAAAGDIGVQKRRRSGRHVAAGEIDSYPLEVQPRAATKCSISRSKGHNEPIISPAQYPGSVKCYNLAAVISVSTKTVTAKSTSTVTAAIQTITAASLTTQTATATTELPQATFYAACGDDNLVSSINGQGISQFGGPPLSDVSAGSAYDCCVACQLAGNGCKGGL